LKYSTVQNLWRNRVNNPHYDTLRAIADALGVTVDELEWPKGEDQPQSDESIATPGLIRV
jgi:transcriptional regulator with XRE-family HTH domain